MKSFAVTINRPILAMIDTYLTHLNNVSKQASCSRLHILRRMRAILKKEELIQMYFACIRSVIEYNSEVFIGLTENCKNQIEKINRRAYKIICGNTECHSCLFPPALRERLDRRAQKTIQKLMRQPTLVNLHLPPSKLPRSGHLRLSHMNTHRRKQSFKPLSTIRHNKNV